MKNEWTVSEIAKFIEGEVRGDGEARIRRIIGITEAEPGDITFIGNPKYKRFASTTRASCIIVPPDFIPEEKTCIVVKDPYLSFAMVLSLFYPETAEPGFISEKASISPSASIGEGARIYPFTFIGEEVHIGEGSSLLPFSVLLKGVRIGRNCRIGSGVFIGTDVTIGDDVVIQSGAVIGSDGFGFVKVGEEYRKIPQKGRIRIGDRVEIGAGVTIDRSAVGSTEIGDGTKIDNLVHIGHGVKIGKNCIIVAQCGISGSTRIEDGAILAGQVGIVGHVRIGKGTILGAKSGISNDVPDGEMWTGYPAIPHRDFLRIQAIIKTLPSMREELMSLNKRLKEVESLLHELKERGGINDGT